jgi:hypothetical protein
MVPALCGGGGRREYAPRGKQSWSPCRAAGRDGIQPIHAKEIPR